MDGNIIERGLRAAELFLMRRGYEILDSSLPSTDIVARCEDAVVFVDVSTRVGTGDGFADTRRSRAEREIAAARWLGEHAGGKPEEQVRFDDIAIMVLANDRAILRHHVNSLGSMEG